MMTPQPLKTPMQMRLEAERRANPPPSRPLGEADPSKRPLQQSDGDAEQDATAEWLAHIEAGRIQVR
jgi:hypothetical protein